MEEPKVEITKELLEKRIREIEEFAEENPLCGVGTIGYIMLKGLRKELEKRLEDMEEKDGKV